jgi:hypothetical protein
LKPIQIKEREQDPAMTESSRAVVHVVTKSERRIQQHSMRMTILIAGSRRRQARVIPFMRKLEKSNRALDDAAKKERVEDAECRLQEILSRVDPRPMIRGYSMERSDDGLTLCAITAGKVGKQEIGLLSAGDWPCWNEIAKVVPEFGHTQVAFEAVSRYEWIRRWDTRLQESRIRLEYGLFGEIFNCAGKC